MRQLMLLDFGRCIYIDVAWGPHSSAAAPSYTAECGVVGACVDGWMGSALAWKIVILVCDSIAASTRLMGPRGNTWLKRQQSRLQQTS